MTDDENVPTVTVEYDDSTITVSDKLTAESAMPLIERALEHYLSNDVTAPPGPGHYDPHPTECEDCGHEWEYTGASTQWTTCPNCNTSVKFDEIPPGRP